MTEAAWLRPGRMTDAEIKTELVTATGERRDELEAEQAERKLIRAGMGRSRVAMGGFRGGQRGTEPADV